MMYCALMLLSVALLICEGSEARDIFYDYVAHFDCRTSHGLYLISDSSRWTHSSRGQARLYCTSVTPNPYELVPIAKMNATCYRDYVEHIRSVTETERTYWVWDVNQTTCFPPRSPCPTTATVICENTIPAEVGAPECGETLGVNNGIVTYPSGTKFPSWAYFECNTGYTFLSANTAECDKQGYWHIPPIRCKAYNCTPPVISQGSTSGDGPIYTAKCNSGFELRGDPIVTCTSDTSTTSLPTCTRYLCASPPTVANGHAIVQSYLQGGQAHIACKAGYNLHGANTTTCLTNGSWSHTLGNCISITCTSDWNISNGVVIHGTPPYLVGSSIYVQCKSGYTGGGIVSCAASGTWPTTTCTRIPCEVLPSVENGVALLNDKRAPTLAILACDNGYHLIGTALLHCSTTGVWSAPIPMCKQGSAATAGSSNSSGATSNTTIIVGVASFFAGFLIPTMVFVCILKRRTQEHRIETTKAPVQFSNKIDLPDLKENDAYGIGTSSEETHYDTI